MRKILILLVSFFLSTMLSAQSNIVTYAGNTGKETFYDVMQITDGTFLVCGYADDLNWIPTTVPKTELTYTGSIPNSLGNNRYGFILHLSKDLQSILQVVHFPQGAVEDIRFMKTNSLPYQATGDLFISCNTNDTYANDGGYIIAKLDKNFISGIPSQLLWFKIVWAESYAKEMHPWDVTSAGQIYHVSGAAHGSNWSAMYKLNENGVRMIVSNWRTHWLKNGTEWKGTPAVSNPFGNIDSVNYSGIAFKIGGRCELRSWTVSDFNTVYPDGNGGGKKGKWPADFLFNSPCDPNSPTATGPGYNGYSYEACCPVWGASCVAVDRRNGNMYLGMNFKSYFNPGSTPDFEPAVIAFDSTGTLLWWSRLYHEITPAGDTIESIPDQYVDVLSIDYTNNLLVVAARAHGNNTENLWEGNTLTYNPTTYGFQNQFTGTNGNIHESWLGKLKLVDGVIMNSTYVAELAEGTSSLGTPYTDPNLSGWPDLNTGWPNVNTTRITKNNMKISSNGDVCIIGVGRRTMTTANAYQRNVSPYSSGQGCWNSFVRVYESNFHKPKYSSLVVGAWDTLTQLGGSNTELYGLYKTADGVICVGRQTADGGGVPNGNNLPVINVTPWGAAAPLNESALLVYYKASNIFTPTDSISNTTNTVVSIHDKTDLIVYPNPATDKIFLSLFENQALDSKTNFQLFDIMGKLQLEGNVTNSSIKVAYLPNGIYTLIIQTKEKVYSQKIIIDKK